MKYKFLSKRDLDYLLKRAARCSDAALLSLYQYDVIDFRAKNAEYLAATFKVDDFSDLKNSERAYLRHYEKILFLENFLVSRGVFIPYELRISPEEKILPKIVGRFVKSISDKISLAVLKEIVDYWEKSSASDDDDLDDTFDFDDIDL